MPATIETNTAPRPITVPERMIGYTIVDSPLSLGRLLVGATSRGVCAVRLGRSDAALEAALAREHPDVELRRDAAPLAPWVNTLLRHLAGRAARLDLPLDVEATAFQQRVWQALRAIPYGETRSYGAVAEAVGHPGAARAVARACAANPVALVIPCHRVVRGDGDPGGYRWGVARKRLLLEQERSAAQLAERRVLREVTDVIGGHAAASAAPVAVEGPERSPADRRSWPGRSATCCDPPCPPTAAIGPPRPPRSTTRSRRSRGAPWSPRSPNQRLAGRAVMRVPSRLSSDGGRACRWPSCCSPNSTKR